MMAVSEFSKNSPNLLFFLSFLFFHLGKHLSERAPGMRCGVRRGHVLAWCLALGGKTMKRVFDRRALLRVELGSQSQMTVSPRKGPEEGGTRDCCGPAVWKILI